LRDRSLGLDIARRRFRRRAAPDGDARDHDLALEIALSDHERIPDAQLARRLYPLPVDPHMAALDGLGRDAARLVEARAPEPTVDTQCLHVRSTSISRSTGNLSLSQASSQGRAWPRVRHRPLLRAGASLSLSSLESGPFLADRERESQAAASEARQ